MEPPGLNPSNTDTWRKYINPEDVEREINVAAPGHLRVVSVSEIARLWLIYSEHYSEGHLNYSDNSCLADRDDDPRTHAGVINQESTNINDLGKLEASVKVHTFNVVAVNQILQQLEVLANIRLMNVCSGPATECFMYHARAALATLPCMEQDTTKKGGKVMCVELVTNRFLHKMVCVLVAISIREAAAGAVTDTLLQLMNATCRRASAPLGGLSLVDIGYEDVN
eukprot:Gb_01006 [translate_table: standard]